MAVTGKWFLSYVSFGSIPGIAVECLCPRMG
nr:MAG TPA: hypothetical protein [Caudoviricetes sp.]